jgi:hypothetical protein
MKGLKIIFLAIKFRDQMCKQGLSLNEIGGKESGKGKSSFGRRKLAGKYPSILSTSVREGKPYDQVCCVWYTILTTNTVQLHFFKWLRVILNQFQVYCIVDKIRA